MSYLEFAFSLVGTRYGYWSGGPIPRDDSTPFYANNAPIPSRTLCDTQGICCTGFINLICRRFSIPIPGVADPSEMFPGGTGAWHKFLEPNLVPFDPAQQYPDGTLLFRPYKDVEDQGHIALIYNGKTLHSYAYVFEPHTAGAVDPGVSHTPIWEHYYTHAAPPSAWLPPLTAAGSSAQ